MRRVLGSRQSLVPRIAGQLLPSHLTSFALIDGRTAGTNVDPPQATDRKSSLAAYEIGEVLRLRRCSGAEIDQGPSIDLPLKP